MPKLNERRYNSSSCAVQGKLYVFGGCESFDSNMVHLRSVERLHLQATEDVWVLFNILERGIDSPMVCEVATNKILIAGGMHTPNRERLNERFILDTSTMQVGSRSAMVLAKKRNGQDRDQDRLSFSCSSESFYIGGGRALALATDKTMTLQRIVIAYDENTGNYFNKISSIVPVSFDE
mmetsp:Transcript_30606/g.35929  ORF Transcript_30606/g.35929 Transcript_30606/m.35929 type:complete len:179 (+) Transcript_30606:89-625(+)